MQQPASRAREEVIAFSTSVGNPIQADLEMREASPRRIENRGCELKEPCLNCRLT
jgi:hypothetical protein